MDDGEIRLGLTVDLSGLQDQMDEATSTIEIFSGSGAAAISDLTEAYNYLDAQGLSTIQTLNAITDAAQRQAEAAANAAADQAAAAQAEIQSNLDKVASMSAVDVAYRQLAIAQAESNRAGRQKSQAYKAFGGDVESFAGVSVLAATEANAAEASEALAAAKRNLADAIDLETEATIPATAAIDGLTEAEVVSSGATQGLGISARQSATAGIGILEGRMMSGNRAASAFLSTTLGLGPVLQAAFPIIGAAALLEVLGQMAKGAYDAYEKFVSLDEVTNKLDEDFKKTQQEDIVNVHSIETATQRLAEANEKATQFRQTAEALHDISFKDIFAHLAQGNLTGAGTDISSLLTAKKVMQDSADATQDSIKLTKVQVEEQHQLRLAVIDANHAGEQGLTTEERRTSELQKQFQLHAEAKRYSQEQDRALGNPVAPDQGNALQGVQDRTARAQAAAQYENQTLELEHRIADARIEAAHAGDASLDPEQKITAELIKQLAIHKEAFESSTTGRTGLDQQLKDLQDQASFIKANTDLWENQKNLMMEGFEQETKSDTDARERERRSEEAAAEAWKKNHETQLDLAKQTADETIRAANDDYAATERDIKLQEQLGQITARTAAQRLLAAEQLKDSKVQGALQTQASGLDPAAYKQEEKIYKQIQDQMTDEARKGDLAREALVRKEIEDFDKNWKKAMNEFNHDLTTAINDWQKGSESASQAFSKMFGSIITSLEDFVIQWLLHKAELWAEDEIMQALGLTKQKTTQGAANVASVTGDASVAAAGTLAYYSAFDPLLAPAAAAGQFNLTMAYAPTATYEYGGIVNGPAGMPIPIMAHAGERVLTAGQTTNFESLVNSGGNRSATLHQVNHFGGGVTQDMLEAHTNKTVARLRSMLRTEAFR